MRQYVTLLGGLMVGLTAHAGQVERCFEQAQLAQPSAAMSVQVNGATVLSDGSVAATFAALASTGSGDKVSMHANAAGSEAIAQAQRCVLSSGRVTWSMARLFEVAPAHRVRPVLFRLRVGGAVVDLEAARKTVDSATQQMTVQFFAKGGRGCTTVAYDARSLAGDDYVVTGLSRAGSAVKNTCAGVTCGTCVFDGGSCGCTEPLTADAQRSYCDHAVTIEEPVEFGNSGYYIGS